MTIATTEGNAPALPGTTETRSVGAAMIREAAAVMSDAHALAVAICNTAMVPAHFKGKPDDCAAAMLYGASLGLDPMQSVKQIYVVSGNAALYARGMVAVTLAAGHEVWTVESVEGSVTVAGKRRGSRHVEESTWDIERAKRAGYLSNKKYESDSRAMLYAKAASEVCRKIAPDVLSGVYAVEELQAEARITVEQVDIPRSPLAAALKKGADPEPASEEPTEIEKAVTWFASRGVSLDQLEAHVGSPVADWTPADLDSLRGFTPTEEPA